MAHRDPHQPMDRGSELSNPDPWTPNAKSRSRRGEAEEDGAAEERCKGTEPDMQNMVIFVPFSHCGNGYVDLWVCGNGFVGLWILVECGNVEMGISVLL
jgi:hypothetical protein